ncbi:MAG: signal peptidase I [Desulfobacteraceae bacterium]|nr:MAG: signal peptidase I [Desulfobacteraceae bacterium]
METETNPADATLLKSKSNGREWVEAAIIALLLVVFIRTFLAEPFRIPSGSMIPTLVPGDRILVNKFIYGPKIPFTDQYIARIKKPQRGDIVVFKYPKDENLNYIKRVIGIEGDRIEIKNNILYIHSKKIETKNIGKYAEDNGYNDKSIEYLFDVDHFILTKDSTHQDFGPIDVPKDHFFVMGDNRDNSQDSRVWGFVADNKIKGKAFMIFWSWPQLKRSFQIIK